MTQTPTHSERPHARLGASAAYRYTKCTASVLASVGVPSYSSDFAREGTAAHEMAQDCLENKREAIEWVDREIDGFVVDEDWAEAVQLYLDTCRQYTGRGWTVWVERPITLEALNPPEEMYGTADFVSYHPVLRTLVVCDLKFGRGVGVEATDNPQLKYYALGAYLGLPSNMEVEKIEAIIVQPRIPYGHKVKTASWTPLELTEWSVWLLDKVHVALSGEATFVPGPHCRFCPRSGSCEAQARQAFAMAQDEFVGLTLDPMTLTTDTVAPALPAATSLTPYQIAGILNTAPAFEDFLKAVREYARDGIHRGWLNIDGWTITEGEGRPKWIGDDTAVATNLTTAFGLNDDQVWTKKIATFAAARNALKANLRAGGMKAKDAEGKAVELLKPMTVTNSTGVKLVPLASGRTPASVRGQEFPLLDAPVS